jgi:hypothetical protein
MKGKKEKKFKSSPNPPGDSHASERHGMERPYPPLPPAIPSGQAPVTTEPDTKHHHAKEEKRFKHYVFDFLMLFLAVVAGFFVDNAREHYVEVQREGQFIHSMADDLRADIHQLDSLLRLRKEKQLMIDSILFILNAPNPSRFGNELYYYARWLPRISRMYHNDGTLTQLKNAGNLRLIRSNAARESIMEYDQQIRFWTNIEEREEALIQQYYPSLKTMFDARVFEQMVNGMHINRPINNPQLLLNDQHHLNEFYSHVHFLKNVNTYQIEFGQRRLAQAQSVLEVLKREYDLHE